MILLLVLEFMPESSVEIWGMILMGQNKAFVPALCRGSDPGLASEVYVSFCIL